MKTEEKNKKDFDTVAFFREIKEKIALEMQGKSYEEQRNFIKKILSDKEKYKTQTKKVILK